MFLYLIGKYFCLDVKKPAGAGDFYGEGILLSLSAVDAMLNHNANDGQWLVITVNDRVVII